MALGERKLEGLLSEWAVPFLSDKRIMCRENWASASKDRISSPESSAIFFMDRLVINNA
jgi:hypothetical protein